MSVPVDAADDVGRQRSARILAQVLALGADFGILFGDHARNGRVNRARQIGEIVVALQLLQHGLEVRFVVQFSCDLFGDIPQPLLRIRGCRILLFRLLQLLADPLRLKRQRA